MTDHYNEMKVSPDPSQAEDLRQRLHARMARVSGDVHGRSGLDLDPARLDLDERVAPITISASETTSPGTSDEPPLGPHDQRGTRPWLLAVAAAIVLIVGAAALFLQHARNGEKESDPIDRPVIPTRLPANGWVAFTQLDRSDDRDVYLVREGEMPRRVAGSDTDTSAQVCPAFSPDGGRLVFTEVTGLSPSGDVVDAELVIIEVGADGSTSRTTTVPVEGLSAPPCTLWSPDGRWLAFGDGSAVWLVDAVTGDVRHLAGYAATDLEWLPGTDELAITANGIEVYSVTTGEVRSLGIEGAAELAWSPDGTAVAFTRVSRVGSGQTEHDSTSLWLVDADGTNERLLTAAYRVMHGVGPVWSPDGRYIAYQRVIGCCESHEVVLVTADDNDRGNPVGTEVVISPPTTPGTDGPLTWYPGGVTWSPDGSTLLYNAWNDACYDQSSADCGGRLEGGGLLAVPVDTTQAPFVLADTSWMIGANEGQPWLPMQTWGRQPLG